MLSHGKLDLSYFFGGAENSVDLLLISVADISGRNRGRNNLPRVLEKYVCLFARHIYMTGLLSLCSSFPRAKFPQEVYCTIES